MSRLQTTACPTNYKFTGYERDSETGLDYAFARYYSSRLGRFLSTDPLGGSLGDLQSHNAYAYTHNDPLNSVDPSGAVDCHPEELCWVLGGNNFWDGNPYVGIGGGGGRFDILLLAFTPTQSFLGVTTINNEPVWAILNIYGNWDLLGLLNLSTSGGGGHKFVNQKLLAGCIQDLFGVALTQFAESSQGTNGSFQGWGSDILSNSGNNANISVTNDIQTYSGEGLKALRDSRGNPPLPQGTTALAGLTLWDQPYVNYTANNLPQLKQPASMAAETQVHELGNSLHYITGAAFNPATVPGSDNDAGQALENCVRKRGGFSKP